MKKGNIRQVDLSSVQIKSIKTLQRMLTVLMKDEPDTRIHHEQIVLSPINESNQLRRIINLYNWFPNVKYYFI